MKNSKPKKNITATYTSKFRLIYPAKAAAFVAGFIVIFLFLGKIFEPKWYYYMPESDHIGYTDKFANFYNSKKDTIDVFFLGPSTGLDSFIPMEMYKSFGYTSYVLSSGSQMLSTSYYLLKEMYEYQHPKVVVLDVSSLRSTEVHLYELDYFKNYQVSRQLRGLENKYKSMLTSKPPSTAFEEWMIPLIKFHNRWSELSKTDFSFDRGISEYPSFYKGSFISTSVQPYWGFKRDQAEVDITDTVDFTMKWNVFEEEQELIERNSSNIDAKQSHYFEKIYQFCKDNEINLICIKGPSIARWSLKHHNIVEQYLSDFGIEFIDYNYGIAKLDIDWNTETEDHGLHVNYYGALKSTQDIGKRISSLGIFADHRDEDAYADWNEAVKEYDEFMRECLSTGNEKAYRFLDSLIENYQDNKNKVILISVMDDVSDGWNEKYDDYRRKLGLNADLYDNYRCSYAAVIEDGNIIYEKQGDELLLYHDAIYDNEGTPHKLEVISAGMGQGNYCNIKIDDVDYACHAKGLNIVVYDKSTNSVDTSVAIDTFGDGYFYKKN